MVARASGCRPAETTTRFLRLIAQAIITASAAAEAPSYIEALAISQPQISAIIDWNS